MRFLIALFWIIVGVLLTVFAYVNFDRIASIELWDKIVVDVKIPLLLLVTYLIGFLPTFLILRARIWGLKRRLEAQAKMHVANTPGAGIRKAAAAAPVEGEEARVATDSKVWPAQ
jgi:putative membrane protein